MTVAQLSWETEHPPWTWEKWRNTSKSSDWAHLLWLIWNIQLRHSHKPIKAHVCRGPVTLEVWPSPRPVTSGSDTTLLLCLVLVILMIHRTRFKWDSLKLEKWMALFIHFYVCALDLTRGPFPSSAVNASDWKRRHISWVTSMLTRQNLARRRAHVKIMMHAGWTWTMFDGNPP